MNAGDPKEFFTENVNDLLDTLIERTPEIWTSASDLE